MNETKEEILKHSYELFMRFGIRRTTMDDIAKSLGISKKTIYEHYRDKNEIVEVATEVYLEKQIHKWKTTVQESKNAIEQLYQFSNCIRQDIKNLNEMALYDLQKFHRSAWTKYVKFKKEFVFNSLVNTIRSGIREGYFRESIHPEILATLRIEEIQLSFNKNVFPEGKYTMEDIQFQLYYHFVYGLLTEKGKKLYEDINKNHIHEKQNSAA